MNKMEDHRIGLEQSHKEASGLSSDPDIILYLNLCTILNVVSSSLQVFSPYSLKCCPGAQSSLRMITTGMPSRAYKMAFWNTPVAKETLKHLVTSLLMTGDWCGYTLQGCLWNPFFWKNLALLSDRIDYKFEMSFYCNNVNHIKWKQTEDADLPLACCLFMAA